MSEDGLKRDAAEIGLDQAKFNQCMASGAEAARVKRDREDGMALGVNATPTFFIGRQVVSGVPDLDEFSRLIDQELAAQGVGLSSAAAAARGRVNRHARGRPKRRIPPKPPPLPKKLRPRKPPPNPPRRRSAYSDQPGRRAVKLPGEAVTCSEAEAAKKQPTLINTEPTAGIPRRKNQASVCGRAPGKEYRRGANSRGDQYSRRRHATALEHPAQRPRHRLL